MVMLQKKKKKNSFPTTVLMYSTIKVVWKKI